MPEPVADAGQETRAEGVAGTGGIRGRAEHGGGNRDGWTRGRLDGDSAGAGRGHPGADPPKQLIRRPAGLPDQQDLFVFVGKQVPGAIHEPPELRSLHPGDLLGRVGGERDPALLAGFRVPQHRLRIVRANDDDLHVAL